MMLARISVSGGSDRNFVQIVMLDFDDIDFDNLDMTDIKDLQGLFSIPENSKSLCRLIEDPIRFNKFLKACYTRNNYFFPDLIKSLYKNEILRESTRKYINNPRSNQEYAIIIRDDFNNKDKAFKVFTGHFFNEIHSGDYFLDITSFFNSHLKVFDQAHEKSDGWCIYQALLPLNTNGIPRNNPVLLRDQRRRLLEHFRNYDSGYKTTYEYKLHGQDHHTDIDQFIELLYMDKNEGDPSSAPLVYPDIGPFQGCLPSLLDSNLMLVQNINGKKIIMEYTIIKEKSIKNTVIIYFTLEGSFGVGGHYQRMVPRDDGLFPDSASALSGNAHSGERAFSSDLAFPTSANSGIFGNAHSAEHTFSSDPVFSSDSAFSSNLAPTSANSDIFDNSHSAELAFSSDLAPTSANSDIFDNSHSAERVFSSDPVFPTSANSDIFDNSHSAERVFSSDPVFPTPANSGIFSDAHHADSTSSSDSESPSDPIPPTPANSGMFSNAHSANSSDSDSATSHPTSTNSRSSWGWNDSCRIS